MSKVIKVDVLKEVLKDIIPVDEKGTAALEAIMEHSEDFDEDAINARITEASEKAKAEASSEYAKKVHEMFFTPSSLPEDLKNDPPAGKTDPDPAIDDIWEKIEL